MQAHVLLISHSFNLYLCFCQFDNTHGTICAILRFKYSGWDKSKKISRMHAPHLKEERN